MWEIVWDPFYERNVDEEGALIMFRNELSLADTHLWVPPHFHNAAEIMFVVEGEYCVRVGTEERVMKAGDIAFVDSLTPHLYSTVTNTVVYAFVFEKNIRNNTLRDYKFPDFMPKNQAFSIVKEMFDKVYPMWENSDLNFKRGFAYALVGTLMQYYPLTEKKNAKSNENFLDVLHYLEENYKKDLNLDHLASKFGYTTTYFSRLFNKITGMNLREYINRRRIKEVLQILDKSPRMALNRVAELVGYSSWNTFHRAYVAYGTNHKK